MSGLGVKPYVTQGIATVDPQTEMREIVRCLCRTSIVAVCEQGRLVGSLTQHDIARCSGSTPGRSGLKALDLMTPDFSFCFEDTDVNEVERLMRDTGVDRVVVLDRRGRVVGSVALDDVSNSRAG